MGRIGLDVAESLGAAVLTVTVDDQQYQAGLNRIKRDSDAAAGKVVQSFDGIAGALRGLAGVAGIVGLGALAQQIIATGQESQRAEIQIKSLASAYGEAGQAAQSAVRIQQTLGISAIDAQQGFSQLYAALRGTGIGLRALEVLFVGISNAARLSGAGTMEAQAALLQLKQGLASGVLQGDELRSVLEQLPALAQAIAGELGVNVGRLRQLGSEGKISAETVFNAAKKLAGAAAPGRTELEGLGIAFKNLQVEAAKAFGPALTETLTTVTAGILAFKGYIESNRQTLTAFGASVVNLAKTLAPFVIGIMAVRAAFQAWALAAKGVALAQSAVLALSGPKGWAAIGIGIGVATLAAAKLEEGFKGIQVSVGNAKKEAQGAIDQFKALLSASQLTPNATAPITQDQITQLNISKQQELSALKSESAKREIANTNAIAAATRARLVLETALGLSAEQRVQLEKQASQAEGTGLLLLQNRLAIEEAISQQKAAQAELNREQAKPATDPTGKLKTSDLRSTEKIEELLGRVEEANNGVRKAYADAGKSLAENALTAARTLQDAQKNLDSVLRGGFDFLTPKYQQEQLKKARAAIQPLVDQGVIRQGINISTPEKLFQVAGFAENLTGAQDKLVDAQNANTRALDALSKKDWAVNVNVAADGSVRAGGDVLAGAM
jgi:tape measure domain-containing protein